MSETNLRRALTTVHPEDLTAYLGGTGWVRRKDFPRHDLLVFDSPAGLPGDIHVVFPASAEARDFPDHVERAVRGLAAFEDREVDAVVFDIVKSESDRLRVRLISEVAAANTLPLGFSVRLVRGLYDLVVASACAEIQPQPFYPRAKKQAFHIADSCRFGQTSPGSFVASIEIPVTPSAGQLELGSSFGRRVTDRLLRGFGRLRDAVIDGDAGDPTESYKEGLNANMCEALLPLREDIHDLQIELIADFSRRIPMTEGVPTRVYLETRAFEYMASAARTLRGPGQSKPRVLAGLIVRLSAEPDEDDDEQESDEDDDRWVTLRFVDGGRKQHVRFTLDGENYRRACDAHRDGLRVSVGGMLERMGKGWRLLSITQFSVVPGEPAAQE